jgi:hypothetical protein
MGVLRRETGVLDRCKHTISTLIQQSFAMEPCCESSVVYGEVNGHQRISGEGFNEREFVVVRLNISQTVEEKHAGVDERHVVDLGFVTVSALNVSRAHLCTPGRGRSTRRVRVQDQDASKV